MIKKEKEIMMIIMIIRFQTMLINISCSTKQNLLIFISSSSSSSSYLIKFLKIKNLAVNFFIDIYICIFYFYDIDFKHTFDI